MQDIFSRPWFTRLWTLQEIALAQKAVVMCGKHTIDWDYMVLGLGCIAYKQVDNPYVLTERELNARIGAYRRLRLAVQLKRGNAVEYWDSNEEIELTLLDLLNISRQKEATERMDKVYAILGVCSALGFIVPEPDYSKPVEEAYIEFTQAAIQSENKLNVLYSTGNNRVPNLPSWVPDWSQGSGQRPRPWFFNATKGSSSTFTVSSDVRVLQCSGRKIDRIVQVARRRLASPNEASDSQTLLDLYVLPAQEWVKIAEAMPTYSDELQLNDALCRTLVRDGTMNPTADAYNNRQDHNSQIERHLPQGALEGFRAWKSMVLDASNAPDLIEDSPEGTTPTKEDARRIMSEISRSRETALFQHYFGLISQGLTFFATEVGHMGTAMPVVQAGDCIALIGGLQVPFVLRSVGKQWCILGPAYVHGIMDGEAWDDEEDMQQEFEII